MPTVTKDLSLPMTSPQTTDTTSPWSQYDQVYMSLCHQFISCVHFLQLLVSTITSIQVLIDEHLLKEDPTERKYTNCHADAIHLKIKLVTDDGAVIFYKSILLLHSLLTNEVLLLTYQRLQILALKEIHTNLISARSQLQNELSTASQMLAMYDSAAGSEFSSLAQEYRQILAEIRNKQWALRELPTSK